MTTGDESQGEAANAGARCPRPPGRRPPVAELAPLPCRPRAIDWETFIAGSDRWRADARLAEELEELLPDTTEGAPPP